MLAISGRGPTADDFYAIDGVNFGPSRQLAAKGLLAADDRAARFESLREVVEPQWSKRGMSRGWRSISVERREAAAVITGCDFEVDRVQDANRTSE